MAYGGQYFHKTCFALISIPKSFFKSNRMSVSFCVCLFVSSLTTLKRLNLKSWNLRDDSPWVHMVLGKKRPYSTILSPKSWEKIEHARCWHLKRTCPFPSLQFECYSLKSTPLKQPPRLIITFEKVFENVSRNKRQEITTIL